MVSVGIDVSKGKSMVCFMRPYGEVLISPYNLRFMWRPVLPIMFMLFIALFNIQIESNEEKYYSTGNSVVF